MDNNHSTDNEPSIFDASPYLKLVIDKEGRWFQNGAEIIHPKVLATFYQALEPTPDGGFQVRLGREICRVEVEDTPFVVNRVLELEDGGLELLLNDGAVEQCNPDLLYIGESNVPYTEVKDRAFTARFSRPAYYSLAEHIRETDGEFYLDLNGKQTRIRFRSAEGAGQGATST